jgi:hypothetical protein
VQAIINRLRAQGPTLSPEALVEGCLDNLGAYEISDETRGQLIELAKSEGEIRTSGPEFDQRVAQMLQSMVATTEYIFA